MIRVYLSVPLTGVPRLENKKVFYEKIGEVCEKAGMQVFFPYKHTDPVCNLSLSPRQVYTLDRCNLAEADLVIAYTGLPSLGVGSEIQLADVHGIPVWLLYEKGRPVSRMVRGNPAVKAEIVGVDYNHIVSKLERRLAHSNFCVRRDNNFVAAGENYLLTI